MKCIHRHTIWVTALIFFILAGCCDTQKTGVTVPVVASATPTAASTGICPNATLTATFSEAMNASTISTGTFTVTGPGATAIAGQVTYDVSNNMATFAPAAALSVKTVYTATLNTGARDTYGNALASNFVWSFTTAANGCRPAPSVIRVTPVTGATGICPNASVSITFNEAMNATTLNATTFTLSGAGTSAVAGVVTYSASTNTATLTPNTPLAVNTLYTATVTPGVQDTFGNALPANYPWTFTTAANGCTPPPVIVSVTPAAGATATCPNAPVSILFNEAMDASTINATTFTLSGPGTTAVAGLVTYNAMTNTATLTPSSPLAVNTLYTATVTTGAHDIFGNPLAANYPWTFTTAANGCTPPPVIVSVAPAVGATAICPNAPVSITFNEAMNAATLNTTTFTLSGPGSTTIAGSVTYNTVTNTATFTPTSPLAVNTLYTATLTTGAQDTFGNPLPANYSWTFTTAANGCTPPPVIVSVTPAPGAIAICPSAPVSITFNEAMNPSTINTTTVTLNGPGTTAVAGVVTYNASTNTATLTPSSPLSVNTLYTATVTTGALDTFGNPLAANYSWTFTTAANGCTPPPAVASILPAASSTGVCPNAPISVTFNEAMNPATINALTFTLSPGIVGTITGDSTNKTFTFTPSTGLALNVTYTATISTGAQDAFGNALPSNFAWTFQTAANGCNPLPTVLSVTPTSGATGVCPNKIVSATFSEAMAPLSINTQTFTLTGGGVAVAGSVSYAAGSNTAIFTPATTLALNTLYTATITTGVEDLFGNFLAAPLVSTFTTGPSNCEPPLPPVSVSPPNGSVAICTSTVASATFPQPMNPASINSSTFTLTGPGLTPVAGNVTHDVTNEIYTFAPTADLDVSTTYTATITTGATDPFGNALASNYVWTFTTAATPCNTGVNPTVISVLPVNGAGGICPSAAPSATFSEAMDPATISAATFTLAPGVTGTVALDGSGKIATYTPSAPLSLATTYTATITTGAQDLSGNPLLVNYVWTFTTATQACQAPVPLGSAANFDVLAGSTVTNNGPTQIIGGNLGLSPGTSITGFPPGQVVPPAVEDDTDPTAAQAQFDLTYAYNYAAGLANGAVLASDLSGLTITPGLYTNANTVQLSSGSVTLDAQGNADSVFIFQVGSALTSLAGTQVILAGGAQAKNIFWQVGSSATLGTSSGFVGTIMAYQAITLDSGATLVGRALARNAAVSLASTTVTAP